MLIHSDDGMRVSIIRSAYSHLPPWPSGYPDKARTGHSVPAFPTPGCGSLIIGQTAERTMTPAGRSVFKNRD